VREWTVNDAWRSVAVAARVKNASCCYYCWLVAQLGAECPPPVTGGTPGFVLVLCCELRSAQVSNISAAVQGIFGPVAKQPRFFHKCSDFSKPYQVRFSRRFELCLRGPLSRTPPCIIVGKFSLPRSSPSGEPKISLCALRRNVPLQLGSVTLGSAHKKNQKRV